MTCDEVILLSIHLYAVIHVIEQRGIYINGDRLMTAIR